MIFSQKKLAWQNVPNSDIVLLLTINDVYGINLQYETKCSERLLLPNHT